MDEATLKLVREAIHQGLQQGEPVEKIKRAMINAGYSGADISEAFSSVPQPSQMPAPVEPTSSEVPEPTPQVVPKPSPPAPVEPKPAPVEPVSQPVPEPTPPEVSEPTPEPVFKPSPKPIGTPEPTTQPEPKPVSQPEPTPSAPVEPAPQPKPTITPTRPALAPQPVFKPAPEPIGTISPQPLIEPSKAKGISSKLVIMLMFAILALLIALSFYLNPDGGVKTPPTGPGQELVVPPVVIPENTASIMTGFGDIKPVEWLCRPSTGDLEVVLLNAAGGTISSISAGGFPCSPSTLSAGSTTTCIIIDAMGCNGVRAGERFESDVVIEYLSPLGEQEIDSGTVSGPAEGSGTGSGLPSGVGIFDPGAGVSAGFSGFSTVKPNEWECNSRTGNLEVVFINAAGGEITGVTVGNIPCNPNIVGAGRTTTCNIFDALGCKGSIAGQRFQSSVEISYVSPSGLERTSAGTVWGPAE